MEAPLLDLLGYSSCIIRSVGKGLLEKKVPSPPGQVQVATLPLCEVALDA